MKCRVNQVSFRSNVIRSSVVRSTVVAPLTLKLHKTSKQFRPPTTSNNHLTTLY